MTREEWCRRFAVERERCQREYAHETMEPGLADEVAACYWEDGDHCGQQPEHVALMDYREWRDNP